MSDILQGAIPVSGNMCTNNVSGNRSVRATTISNPFVELASHRVAQCVGGPVVFVIRSRRHREQQECINGLGADVLTNLQLIVYAQSVGWRAADDAVL